MPFAHNTMDFLEKSISVLPISETDLWEPGYVVLAPNGLQL
jgi:hypothetical protein